MYMSGDVPKSIRSSDYVALISEYSINMAAATIQFIHTTI